MERVEGDVPVLKVTIQENKSGSVRGFKQLVGQFPEGYYGAFVTELKIMQQPKK